MPANDPTSTGSGSARYQQDLTDLSALPSYIELPDAPFAMAGYRRGGS